MTDFNDVLEQKIGVIVAHEIAKALYTATSEIQKTNNRITQLKGAIGSLRAEKAEKENSFGKCGRKEIRRAVNVGVSWTAEEENFLVDMFNTFIYNAANAHARNTGGIEYRLKKLYKEERIL